MTAQQIGKVTVEVPDLGARIREARIAAGMSQEAMAEYLDKSWMTVHRWEHNKRTLTAETLEKIAARCNLTIGDFLGKVA